MTENDFPSPRLFTCQVKRLPIKHISKAKRPCSLTARPVSCPTLGGGGDSRSLGEWQGCVGESVLQERLPLSGVSWPVVGPLRTQRALGPFWGCAALLISGSSRLWRGTERVQRSPPSLSGRPPCSCSCWEVLAPSGLPRGFSTRRRRALPPLHLPNANSC